VLRGESHNQGRFGKASGPIRGKKVSMIRIELRRALAGIVVALFASSAAHTQPVFPSRSVDLIVPYPPGGVTDIVARSLSHQLQSITGQPFVVENKPGATGIVAANFVKHAAPDGYTLMMGSASQMTVQPALKTTMPFDSETDFAALSLVGTTPYVLLVNAEVPARTMAELIQLLHANPGKYNYSTSGVGSMPHLLGEMFKQMAGVDITHIPYQGNSPATAAAAAGDVQITFDTVISARPFIEAGKIRALGIAASKPIAALPGVPAIASSLPGFIGESWLGLFSRADTPATLIDRLRTIVREAVHSSEFVRQAAAGGFDVPELSVQEVDAFLKADAARWRDVAHKANIVLQ
jgi:tripartite-type tricarboxylate transporter receptor subunit TctC